MSERFTNASIAGQYELLAKLGSGGQGVVYRGRDIQQDDECAIKVFPNIPGLESDFMQEGEISKSLPEHPNILHTRDFGKAAISLQSGARDSRVFIAMDLAEGSLHDIKELLSTPIHARVAAIGMAATGLHVAHRAGIMHLDVKLPNLLFSKGQVKVADFGIARNLPSSTINPTTQAYFAGSYAYSAPEQLRRKPSKRSDIYGLGVATFKLLTDRLPFRASAPNDIVDWVDLHNAPDRAAPEFNTLLGSRMNEVYAELEAPVRKTLEALPADRYSTMEEYKEALYDALRKGEEKYAKGTKTYTATTQPRPTTPYTQQSHTSAPAVSPRAESKPNVRRPGPSAVKVAPFPSTQTPASPEIAKATEKKLPRRSFLKAGAWTSAALLGLGEVGANLHAKSERDDVLERYKGARNNVASMIEQIIAGENNHRGVRAEYIGDIGRALTVYNPTLAREVAEKMLQSGQYESATQIGLALEYKHSLQTVEIFFRLQQEQARILASPRSIITIQQEQVALLQRCQTTLAINCYSQLPDHLVSSRGRTNGNKQPIAVPGFDDLTQSIVVQNQGYYKEGQFGENARRLMRTNGIKSIEAVANAIKFKEPGTLIGILEDFDISKASRSTLASMVNCCGLLASTDPSAVQRFINRLEQTKNTEYAQLLSVIAAPYMPKQAKEMIESEKDKDLKMILTMTLVFKDPTFSAKILRQGEKDSQATKWLDFALHASDDPKKARELIKQSGRELNHRLRLLSVALVLGQSFKAQRFTPNIILPSL